MTGSLLRQRRQTDKAMSARESLRVLLVHRIVMDA